MNGADRLCDALLVNGVDVCFANPGTSEMHFVAALDRKPQMRCVLGLFEGVVTGAADGYGRMADKPAATLLHLGPGLANGLANIHNARRAASPMINIVGNHATYHLQYDAPLTSDIESLARPMSHWVRSMQSPQEIEADTNEAWRVAKSGPGIATLILPADIAWAEAGVAPVQSARPLEIPLPPSDDMLALIEKAVDDGKQVALLLGGKALRSKPLEWAGRIAAKTGTKLLAETSNGRMQRGAGRVPVERVPYRIDAAVELMRSIDMLVLVGAAEPAAFFAYPGKPSRPHRDDCEVIALAGTSADMEDVLARLADKLNATAEAQTAISAKVDVPLEGSLTGDAVACIAAHLLPENAIVCDESITAGWMFYGLSRNAPPHDLLELTGGAIGMGIPVATGAAVACPDRKVICLQADGSGMYTVQGLWTQARENLDVLTIVFSNRTYGALHGEMRNVGVNDFGANAKRMLNLDNPDLDWVALSKGLGVDAARADTVEAFTRLMEEGIRRRGPFLIEAVI